MTKTLAAWLTLAIIIIVVALVAGASAFTGDEPRYFYYALAFARHGTFSMSVEEWNALHTGLGYPGTVGNLPAHAVLMPTLFSAFARAGRLAGGRWAVCGAGIAGFVFLYELIRLRLNATVAFAAVAFAAISAPVVAYFTLFVPEVVSLAVISGVWWATQRQRSLAVLICADIAAVLLPFIHLRNLPIAGVLLVLLATQPLPNRSSKQWVIVLSIALLGLAAYYELAVHVYAGNLLGPVNVARPAGVKTVIPILAFQLLAVRHGLFTYAPIWLVAIAGLLVGLIRKQRLAWQAAVLLAAAAVALTGPSAGECPPARFWVAAVPFLTVGLAVWFSTIRNWVQYLVTALVGVLSLANTTMFLWHRDAFIENRMASRTYLWMTTIFSHFNFSYRLPLYFVEQPDERVVLVLLFWVTLLIAALAALTFARRLLLRRVLGAFVFTLSLFALALTLVQHLSARQFEVTEVPSTSVGEVAYVLNFKAPTRVAYILAADPWQEMLSPSYESEHTSLQLSTDGTTFNAISTIVTAPLVVPRTPEKILAARIQMPKAMARLLLPLNAWQVYESTSPF